MKTIYITLKNKDLKALFIIRFKMLVMLTFLLLIFSCSNEGCDYDQNEAFDCPNIQLNYGDPCDSNGDSINDGTINQFCECIPDMTIISQCPGFIQNGDFEDITGDPNNVVDEDIDLATSWKELWQSGSLADLFDNATTNFGSASFVAPTPASGVFAGMWIENSTNQSRPATYREGMFNQLTASILPNSGSYTLTFDYANMSQSIASNDIKVGVYGVNHVATDPLPASPTGLGTPSNLDLFGSSNTVFLGEVVITSTTTNTWSTATFTIDTNTLTGMPGVGVNHIMITNSHLPFMDYGKMFIGFDNFCLTN